VVLFKSIVRRHQNIIALLPPKKLMSAIGKIRRVVRPTASGPLSDGRPACLLLTLSGCSVFPLNGWSGYAKRPLTAQNGNMPTSTR